MAYVADFTTKSNAAKATTLAFATADLPEHSANDYLVLAITCEAEVAVTITATAGWTLIGTTVGNPATATGLYSAMFYKLCAGATESCTLTLSVTNASHGHAFLIKDADLTTFLDGTPSAANVATASQFTSASITTTTNDTLLLYYVGVDSTTTTPTACHTAPDGKSVFLDSSDNAGANVTAGSKVMASGAGAWYFQRTAGATPIPAWNMSLTGMTNRFTVGIKNKSGGMIPAYPDDTAVMGTKIFDGHRWVSATNLNNEAWKATPLSVTSFITHLGTLTGTFSAGSQVADTHINPYSNSVGLVPATSATALTGSELQMATAIDMSTGWIVGSMLMSGPKLANFNHGTIKQGGTFLAVGSTANYRIFQVMARDNLVNTEGRAVVSVQASQTQTQSGQSATPPTASAINRLWILNRGNTAALALYCADFHLVQKIVAAGGDANYPVGSEELWSIGKCFRIKLIQRIGASGLMPMVPVQIGGGDAINFQIDAGALQFPRIYSRTFREINYHGADNAIGISYAGKAGDIIKHTNSVVTSESPYYWEINAAATNAATWDFTGLVIVKANVTLRNVMTFSGMAFSNCPSLVFSSCTVTDCKIAGVPATSASLIVNATTAISYCTFIVATVTAGNHFVALADPSIFSNCSFTGGGGHAIRITTPGTYTFTGNSFTGFGANGSTGAAIINDSGGVITLNIAGGGSTPTYKNGTGTSTVINNSKTLTVTGLIPGSDVVVRSSGTSTILASVDANAGSTWNYTYSGAHNVDIDVIKPGYVIVPFRNIALTTTDSSLPVSQLTDRNYV